MKNGLSKSLVAFTLALFTYSTVSVAQDKSAKQDRQKSETKSAKKGILDPASLDRLADEVVGIGLQIRQTDDGRFEVINLMVGTPVEVEGRVKKGDMILAVTNEDGEVSKTKGKDLVDVVKLLRGKSGTEARIRFKSADGKSTLTTTLQRVTMKRVGDAWKAVEPNDSDAESAQNK